MWDSCLSCKVLSSLPSVLYLLPAEERPTHCSHCPGPHFTHLLNFQASTYSFPAILSCCPREVSQGTYKANSLSSVSSSVKMFFRYPQTVLTTGKLRDHDLFYCQVFCWILFCRSPVFSYFIFFMELEWVLPFGSIFLYCVHKVLPPV